MINKKFDPSLHNKYDDVGRTVVKNYFKSKLNIDAIDNSDIYGVDLILTKNNNVVGYAEVEVRNNWDKDNFPFDTLNVPSRKKKLLENEMPTFFFSVNKILTRMFCCKAEIVLQCPLVENKNKYVKDGEYFYKVPVNDLKLIIL